MFFRNYSILNTWYNFWGGGRPVGLFTTITGLGRKNKRGGLLNFLPLFYNCFRDWIADEFQFRFIINKIIDY